MTRLAFVKLQGLGNDFILAEGAALPAGTALADLARRLCDRHFGIGADGLILRWPSQCGIARMQIFNADGSEPEMCGNGLRCFVRYLHLQGLTDQKLQIETAAGLLAAEVRNESICVDMGQPVLDPEKIPARGFASPSVIAQPLQVDGQNFEVTLVSMGNPHCVIKVADLEQVDFARWGPRLEIHPAFPARINVEFAQVLNPECVRVRVLERGAGPTLACGTGACAVLVAGVLGGWLADRAEVRLPGGSLKIAWPQREGPVWMEGPAEPVFAGEIQLEANHGGSI